MFVQLTGTRTDLLAEAAAKGMNHLKSKLKTITFDNGLEFTQHTKIAKKFEAGIYFAPPYASWEIETNENTNGLI